MKFIKIFENFLEDEVNLVPVKVERAEQGFHAIKKFLENNQLFGPHIKDVSKQGSLRQKTIINPVTDEDEFDVDLVFLMDAMDGWESKDYLNKLHAEFKKSDRYKEKVDRKGKTRCMTIDYEDDFHIDIIPSIQSGDTSYIMNKNDNTFEPTDGDGYAVWFEEKNETVGNNNLIKVVRLMKYIRDFKNTFSVKSVLLTTLLGYQVDDVDENSYTDLPTALKILINNLNKFLQGNPIMPIINNPVLVEENFNRHWDEEKYSNFRDKINGINTKINEAYDSMDEEESLQNWQEIFGADFKAEQIEENQKSEIPQYPLGNHNHAEPLRWPENLIYSVRVDAFIYTSDKKTRLRGINSDARFDSNLAILYKASTNTPEPFKVYWQVVNTGDHAGSFGSKGLRGQIFPRDDEGASLNQWEASLYTGRHWIECFIIKDDYCVARRKFFVNIRNPQYKLTY
jgi:hypothetical protein